MSWPHFHRQFRDGNGQLQSSWFEVECDPFCQQVLRARMAEGCLAPAPIHDDVTTFLPAGPAAEATALMAGWPCQVGRSADAQL